MERPCPLKRATAVARISHGCSIAALRPRRAAARYNLASKFQHQTPCFSFIVNGSYKTGLTRSQEGRRQRARVRAASSLVESATLWSPREPAASRLAWIEGAKRQPTKVLLTALLVPEDVPVHRLPVLLTILEGRADLEGCMIAAGLPNVVAAVLQSDMLQRLLPGGVLQELLLGLLEEQVPALPLSDLREAARLIAAWAPPTSSEVVAPTAATLASVLADRALGRAGGAGGLGSGPGIGATPAPAATAAAAADLTDGEASLLAEALALLRPWLLSYSATAALAGGEGLGEVGLEVEDGGEGAAVEEGLVVGAAREAIAALLARVSSSAAAAAAASNASQDPLTLYDIVSAAAEYGVEAPPELAVAAMRAAGLASPSHSPAQADAAARLAAQLVAQSCGCTGDFGGSALAPEEVGSLIRIRLDSRLGAVQHGAFLSALSAMLRESLQSRKVDGAPSSPTAGAAGDAVRQRGRAACVGLLAALGSAAGGLGAEALTLGMDCATLAATTVAGSGSTPMQPAAGQGVEEEVVVQHPLQKMLQAAAALAAPLGGGCCTADQLCRLAAAAMRLQRAAGDSASAATVGTLLAAVRSEPLQGVTATSIAALIAAAVPTPPQAGTSAKLAPGLHGGEMVLLPGLLDLLLEQLAVAALEEGSNNSAAEDMEEQREGTPGRRGRKDSGIANAGAPHLQLSYEQSTAVLMAIATVAEEAAAAVPSTSDPDVAGVATTTGGLSYERAEMLQAAALAPFRALSRVVRSLDTESTIALLMLFARCQRARVRPHFPPFLWALHERLRVLAPTMGPPAVLAVLRGCAAVRWRPSVLLRELLLPLLRSLQAEAGMPSSESLDGEWMRSRNFSQAATANELADAIGRDAGERTGGGAAAAATVSELRPREWTPAEVHDCLVLLAKLRFNGPLASSMVKLGVSALLRTGAGLAAGGGSEAAAARGGSTTAAAPLTLDDLGSLLRVCVASRYRGATVLRPLMQQLLQAPAAQVPVRVASLAVWAAARLGIVGERLVRWALACCQGPGKLAAAPPQSLANLCWGLAKLGVRPPRAFVAAVTAAFLAQMTSFRPEDLATTLFVLAIWGGRLDGGAAARVVQHLVAGRTMYDGPALCTATWAVQRLTTPAAAAGDAAPDSDQEEPSTPSADAASPLIAESLLSIEDHLVVLLEEGHEPSTADPADPRVIPAAIPDHHLLRFFAACASVGHRPARLLNTYLAALLPRLDALGPCPAHAPAAERRSRLLWSSAKVLSAFDVRHPELLAALEAAATRCQALLRPGHLVGLLSAMAALGHYPSYWAERGLLRQIGLAMRTADVTDAGLVVEALAAWRNHLMVEEGNGSNNGGGSGGAGGTGGVVSYGQRAGRDGEQGNGRAAVAEEEDAGEDGARLRQGPGRRLRGPTPQRVDMLRRVVLQRLTELCAPPPPSLPQTPPPQQQPEPHSPSPQPKATTEPSAPGSPPSGGSLGAAAPPAAGASGGGEGAVQVVGLTDATRLLTALAKLRWQCPPVEAALVRVAARLPVERRRRVPELTTLLWALAALRLDVPEVMDDLQAALMGLPHQQSLAAELSLLESGRAGFMRGADAAAVSSMAAAASSSTPIIAAATPSPEVECPAASAMAAAVAAAGTEGVAATGDVVNAATPCSPPSSSPSKAPSTAGTTSESSGTTNASTSTSVGVSAAAGGSGGGGLLARPAKPSQPQPAEQPTEAGTAAGGGGSGAVSPLDPAAAMAAAAAALNRCYEQHLEGPMGQKPLPSEPWSITDVFKVLWACAKMNRHPGPQILAAAERSWVLHTTAQQQQLQQQQEQQQQQQQQQQAAGMAAAPLHTLTGLLWALSVFRHHNSSFAQRLATQLAAQLAGGDGAGGVVAAAERAFDKQAVQVASCLLAAQADRADSPLNTALPPETRARLVAAWRGRQAARAAQLPNRYQSDLVGVLRKMGFTAAANVPTPDGCAVVDVAVAITAPQQQQQQGAGAPSGAAGGQPPRLLALELVGRHNSAANSPRIVGEAVLKYRLLQARGYMVVPIPCYEWDRIGHQDVWTKMVYLTAKIERRTSGPSGGGATAGGADGVPTAVVASSSGQLGPGPGRQ